mgnify:CR=1 FL=1
MKNFAEEIAYWYFRLNGFFLIDNYVSHKSETNTNSYADNDIIGVRNRFVKEIIGLLSVEDVCPRLKEIVGEINSKSVGIICEVKGGDKKVSSLNEKKIKSCVSRMGLIETDEEINRIVDTLKTKTNYTTDTLSINKIFVTVSDSNITNWEKIELETMIDFIKGRISKYEEKGKAWNHYGSPLFQYLLYEDKKKTTA